MIDWDSLGNILSYALGFAVIIIAVILIARNRDKHG